MNSWKFGIESWSEKIFNLISAYDDHPGSWHQGREQERSRFPVVTHFPVPPYFPATRRASFCLLYRCSITCFSLPNSAQFNYYQTLLFFFLLSKKVILRLLPFNPFILFWFLLSSLCAAWRYQKFLERFIFVIRNLQTQIFRVIPYELRNLVLIRDSLHMTKNCIFVFVKLQDIITK